MSFCLAIVNCYSSHVKPHCTGYIIDNDGYAIIGGGGGGNLDFRVGPKSTYAGVYDLWWGP